MYGYGIDGKELNFNDETMKKNKRLEELRKPAKDLKEAKAQLEEIKNTTLNFTGLDDKEVWRFVWWDKIMEVEKFKQEEEEKKFEEEEELTKISGVTKAKEVEKMNKKVNDKWWYFSIEFSSPVRGGVHSEGKVYAKNVKDAYDKVIKRMDEFPDFAENNVDLFEVWYCDEDQNNDVIITETRTYNEEG